MEDEIDLGIALRMLHRLQLQDGDLGGPYWQKISELLKAAAAFRQRALIAEEQLYFITALSDTGIDRKDASHPQWRTDITYKERRRIAQDYLEDIARMQRCLTVDNKFFTVDDIVRAWNDFSEKSCAVWIALPKNDVDLQEILLEHLKPAATLFCSSDEQQRP